MRILISFLFVVAILGTSSKVTAQDDLGSWTILSLGHKINDKWSLKLAPIVRHRDNLSTYANTSIDFAITYNINKTFSFTLLERHFFIPDDADRNFYFFDLKAKHKLRDKWTFQQNLRYHFGNNINDRIDPDFIRYQPKLIYAPTSKSKFFTMLDPFFRVTDPASLAGIRYEVGYDRSLANGFGVNFQYRYQRGHGDTPIATSHILLFILRKNFEKRTFWRHDH